MPSGVFFTTAREIAVVARVMGILGTICAIPDQAPCRYLPYVMEMAARIPTDHTSTERISAA